MADQLTVDNFLDEIKKMADRDRKKIRTERLIELILELANTEKEDKNTDMVKRIVALEQGYTFIKQETVNNICKHKKIKKMAHVIAKQGKKK